MINSSRGSSPPSVLEKMEGKEGERKSAEKSGKEKRTTLRIIKTDDTDAVPSGTTALDCRAICTIIYRPPPNPPPSPCPPL
ncbi:hypothetical protein ROHU_031142 [Labeo rohita]|uniref:Uncharacterized protein n=1 Tax=Labeo rohita TaxID=84645 RepID=A0A498LNS8_LABRO|nr:hypothetical protein ROHU_031142 [Labeo rohita]